MENLFKDETLYNVVCGCVRETIRAHGNITKDLAGSLAKRVVLTFQGTIISHINQFGYTKLASDAYVEKINQLKAENDRLLKKINKLKEKSRQRYLESKLKDN